MIYKKYNKILFVIILTKWKYRKEKKKKKIVYTPNEKLIEIYRSI